MKVFIFGQQGHGTTAIATLRGMPNETLIGNCSTPKPSLPRALWRGLRRRLGRGPHVDRLRYRNVPHPASFPYPFFSSADFDGIERYLSREKPDLILCCTFPKLIPNSIISHARHAINIHPGLLPERAGGTPNRWSILLGDPETGVTAHYMTDKFDSGEVIHRETMPIRAGMDWGDVEWEIQPLIERAVGAAVTRAASGSGPRKAREQVVRSQRSLKEKDLLIDWTRESDFIERLTRACRPLFCARTVLGNRAIGIWSLRPANDESSFGIAGSIVGHSTDDNPIVRAGNGFLEVVTVEIDGYLKSGRALGLRSGDRFR